MRTKFLSLFLVTILVLTLISGLTVVTAEIELSGEGTADSPYVIASAEDLMYFANKSNESETAVKYLGSVLTGTKVYYRITADIDMSGYIFPGFARTDLATDVINYGTAHKVFFGEIYGGGHVIKNLTVEGAAGAPAGFICKAFNSKIADLGMGNVTIKNGTKAAAFIGEDRSNHDQNGTLIQSCYVKGLTFKSGVIQTAGFIGLLESAYGYVKFVNCYSLDVSRGNGFMGYHSSMGVLADMTNCYSSRGQHNPVNGRSTLSAYEGVSETEYTPIVAGKKDSADAPVAEKLTADKLWSEAPQIFTGDNVLTNNGFVDDEFYINGGLPVLAWQIEGETREKGVFYISPNGDDSNSGTYDNPFKTIEKAKEAVNWCKKQNFLQDGKEIKVYIRGGEYIMDETIIFGDDDSGTEDNPVVYSAHNGEKVVFTGSKHLDSSAVKKVTDDELLNRLISEQARDHLYMIDLNKAGISGIPTLNQLKTQTFYINDVPLYFSRWPNADKSGKQYFIEGKPAKLISDEIGAYNGNNQPVKMMYVDDGDRTKLWQRDEATNKLKDAFLSGGIAHLWYHGQSLIDTIDVVNKIVKTADKHAYNQTENTAANRYLYFEHIFEEIDLPAEYYIDRENGILYFYGVGDMNNPTLEMIEYSQSQMLYFNKASYITFDGIDFMYGSGKAIHIQNGDCIAIKNSNIHSFNGNGVYAEGSNLTIDGCNIYDIYMEAIKLYGGDRETLTSSGNIITNNKIHASAGIERAIYVDGVGHKISHNDIYDYEIGAASFEWSSNLIIEYNRFFNIGKITADAGALYWGRRVTELGNIVRYNYFYDIGSGFSDSGVSAIFCDDGEICPEIYGNIFYKAGKEGYGGIKNVPVRLNGGMFLNFHDNLIVDMYGVLKATSWEASDTDAGVTNYNIPAKWWMYSLGLSVNGSSCSTNFTEEQQALMFSDTWKNAYKDTWWGTVYNYINKDLYTEGKAVCDTGATAVVTQWLTENIPEGKTNFVRDNVLLGGSEILPVVSNADGINRNITAVSENNIKLDLTPSVFENIEDKDFTLTESGIAKIKEFIPGFKVPDFDNMGILTEKSNAPFVLNARIADNGKYLAASYDYEDADGDKEGISQICWYMSDTEDGEYTRLTDGYGKYLSLEEKHKDKYIRYEIVPYDTTCEYGEAVTSEAVLVEYLELSVACGDNGNVIINGADAVDGGNVFVVNGGEVTVYTEPSDGYEVDSVKLNGVAYPVKDNSVSFILKESANIDVVFRKIVSTPSICGNADTYIFPGTYTREGKTYNSFVAFYKMLIPYGATIASYGMKIDGLDAKSDGRTADDVFGIRIFGEAVEEGKTYELQGYVNVKNYDEASTSISYTYTK